MANDVRRDEQDVGNDFRRDAQDVENFPENVEQRVDQGFDNTVNDVLDAPQDLGDALEGAARWVGDKIGGIEGDGRRAENDVDRFGDRIDNSFDSGEQQGRDQGGW